MTSNASAESVLTVLTLICAVVVRLAPFPDFYSIHKRKATGPVQLLPIVTLATNNAFTVLYAYAIRDFVPLFVTNSLGVLTSLVFISVYHHYCQDRAYVYKMCAISATLVGGLAIYTFLGLANPAVLSPSQVLQSLGWAMATSSIVVFAAPLATIKTVIQTKSAASIPFTLCLMYEINASLWLAYAFATSDWFLAAPNMVGVLLGIIQLSLLGVYRPSKAPQHKCEINDDATARGSISVDVERFTSSDECFVVVVSPNLALATSTHVSTQ